MIESVCSLRTLAKTFLNVTYVVFIYKFDSYIPAVNIDVKHGRGEGYRPSAKGEATNEELCKARHQRTSESTNEGAREATNGGPRGG